MADDFCVSGHAFQPWSLLGNATDGPEQQEEEGLVPFNLNSSSTND